MKTYIVDSFTTEAFKGNPAGVCFPDKTLYDSKMLDIAKELGMSETCFVSNRPEEGCFDIRYFSPVMEIPLCGHATLAASKVLFEVQESPKLEFTTIQGIKLPIEKEGDNIIMTFPIYKIEPATAPIKLLTALGITEVLETSYNKETNILNLEIGDAEVLRKLEPDFIALKDSHDGINGVLVTALANDIADYHYRFFWPWSGTNEDPVTGGVQTYLAKYWGDRLDKTIMKSFQSSARTGVMEVELISESKVTISSSAVIVFEGKLKV